MTYSIFKHSKYSFINFILAAAMFCSVGCSSEKPGNTYIAPSARQGQVSVKLSRPGRQHPGNHILAPAYIRNYYVGYFMVDTGASITIVNKSLAKHMKLTPTDDRQLTLTGVGNRVPANVYWLNPLQIGQRNFSTIKAAAIDLDKFTKSKRVPVAGILGMDCLRQQPFTIDFKNKRLTFHDAHNFVPPEGVKPYRFKYSPSGLILVPAILNKKHKAWIMLDTGANSSVSLPYSAISHWPELLKNRSNIQSQGTGVGGVVHTFESSLDSISILGYTLHDAKLTIEKSIERPDAHRVVIGRVGNVILDHFKLTIDCSTQTMWAVWQPPR